ncbi:MAG TPA: hypothetical protein VF721_17550 [Pyrinomonadaceae bacterium]|jgi:hypothetical protein
MKYDYTIDGKDIDNLVSPEVKEKLIKFAVCANEKTGSANSSDEKNWIDFIISAHKQNSRLDSDTLRHWLIGTGKWTAEIASELTIEYGFARNILKSYDKRN